MVTPLEHNDGVRPQPLQTITPASWRGTPSPQQRWLAQGRVPCGDLTILSGNGGSGKTEIAVGLLVSVAAGLGDWLGCVVETGPALFISGEEPEHNVRERLERIAKHRGIVLDAMEDLHLQFPELDATWLCRVDRNSHVSPTPLLQQIDAWIAQHRPRLVVIDSVAAVFDGEAIARRPVRAFLAMLRAIARRHDVAILLLDHPSVRGMADGSGTANSVDWRNSVRSMLHLSDPDREDPDERTLEVKKSNYGRSGDRVKLRWSGSSFTTAPMASAARLRAARGVDELFLRLLEERNAQGRCVTPNKAAGYAPKELAAMPGANGTTAEAFAVAMERLLAAGEITAEEYGPPSKRRLRLVPSNHPTNR
jgi:RecA-family ATPase